MVDTMGEFVDTIGYFLNRLLEDLSNNGKHAQRRFQELATTVGNFAASIDQRINDNQQPNVDEVRCYAQEEILDHNIRLLRLQKRVLTESFYNDDDKEVIAKAVLDYKEQLDRVNHSLRRLALKWPTLYRGIQAPSLEDTRKRVQVDRKGL
jgi:hypothetical protein